MPPVPTVLNESESDRIDRSKDRKSDIIHRPKYTNNLPDIPFDLKLLSFPFEIDRFTQYQPSSLEKKYKFEVHAEHDLGVSIDLINRELYQSDPGAFTLDPVDEKLLEEETYVPQDVGRSKHHAKPVSWLRRSEYISTEQTRFQPQNMEKAEAKVGYNVKDTLREETLYMDRERQVDAINNTFEDNKVPITHHYCKPNVVPVEVYPVFPDFKYWKFPWAQVAFDADPSQLPGDDDGKNLTNEDDLGQAMIRGVMDESGEQFVAYFLPTEETLEKRKIDASLERAYDDDTEYEYKMTREYNWNVKSKLSTGYEENYFFVVRNDGVYYNDLDTRVRLSKRRQKGCFQISNTKLIVHHRPFNAIEHRIHIGREKQLEPLGEQEEFEEEEPEEKLEKRESDEVNFVDKHFSRSRSASSRRSGSTNSRYSTGSSTASSRQSSKTLHSGSAHSGQSGSHESGSDSSRSGSRSPSRSYSRSGSATGSNSD